MIKINIKLDEGASLPSRAHPTDAGADLIAKYHYSIPPHSTELVDTGVAVRIPDGFTGLVFSRSGQGKLGISLANSVGVIDSTYTGTIKVLLRNDGNIPYDIYAGVTKIAQLVVVPIILPKFHIVDELEKTDRGDKGFGSTDMKGNN